MDKVKLEFKIPKTKIIEYNGVDIEVTPFLSVAQQAVLIIRYLEEYFNKPEDALIQASPYDLIGAEYGLIFNILQMNTNIDLENIDDDIYSDTKFLGQIISNITNYDDFREKLENIVYEVKGQITLENSIGKVVSGLIEKAYVILNKISSITPEELEKAQKEGVKLIERLEKSSVLGQGALTPTVEKPKKTRKRKSA